MELEVLEEDMVEVTVSEVVSEVATLEVVEVMEERLIMENNA